ncbi:MAG: NAD-dependent epimerase/dehydratase family protein [Thermoplasmata archaeon]
MPEGEPTGPVVVTGGAGAVGSELVRALLARGREVRVIDNLSGGRREHLPASGGHRLTLTVADLNQPDRYAAVFEGAEELWHLAANTDIRRGTSQSRLDLDQGTLATFHVLEEARKHDVRRALFSSSSVVYGLASVRPTPESYGPLEVQSLYAAAKLAAEGLFSAYAYTYGFRVHIYRFANIVGPRMNHGILYDLFEKLRTDPTRLEVLGDGRQAKGYLRTEDCVGGMLLAADRARAPVNIFNLGTTDQITAGEIAKKVVAVHGGKARIEYTGGERGWVGDVPQTFLAIDKLRALGWEPSSTSAGAIDKTIAEMLAERARSTGPAAHGDRGSAATAR